MNYLQKNKSARGFMSKPTIVIIIIVIGTLILYFFAWNFFNQAIFAVGRPIWSVKNYIVSQAVKIWSSAKNTEQLALQNEKLERELREARIAIETLETYKNENDFLKSILGRSDGENRLIAAILTKPNLSPYDTFVLDAGTDQGVRVNDLVMSGDYIIGTVKEAHPDYSKAVISSAPGESLAVTIGDNNIQTEATGRGGGNFSAKLPKEIDVKIGDLIKLPGLNLKFFGSVGSVEQTQTGSFRTILFSLPVNINELKWVEIIKS
jgi:rod shape-determining protein MreC